MTRTRFFLDKRGEVIGVTDGTESVEEAPKGWEEIREIETDESGRTIIGEQWIVRNRSALKTRNEKGAPATKS